MHISSLVVGPNATGAAARRVSKTQWVLRTPGVLPSASAGRAAAAASHPRGSVVAPRRAPWYPTSPPGVAPEAQTASSELYSAPTSLSKGSPVARARESTAEKAATGSLESPSAPPRGSTNS